MKIKERIEKMTLFTTNTLHMASVLGLTPADIMASFGTILDYLETTVEGFKTDDALVALLQCARDVHKVPDWVADALAQKIMGSEEDNQDEEETV